MQGVPLCVFVCAIVCDCVWLCVGVHRCRAKGTREPTHRAAALAFAPNVMFQRAPMKLGFLH